MQEFDHISTELIRIRKQNILDSERTAKERNLAGQFATPPHLANDIVKFALQLHRKRNGIQINFLEPACGSGSFFSALKNSIDESDKLQSAIGIEIDERFANLSKELWSVFGLQTLNEDFFNFTLRSEKARHSLLITNPPYVRHHHLSSEYKRDAIARISRELNITPSGLSGLYVYFLLLSHKILADGAISAWLIPSEFLDTNYGFAIRQYLSTIVSINRIHRFNPEGTQFDDALVTSCVVFFTNDTPTSDTLIEFTSGDSIQNPSHTKIINQQALSPNSRWSQYFLSNYSENLENTPLFKDFFKIRRGIATGNNSYFILPRGDVENFGIKRENVVPILPSPRCLKETIISGDTCGYPLIEKQLAVLNPQGSMSEIEKDDPALAQYLNNVDEKTKNSYLVRKRNPWFRMEQRTPAPFLLTYMGRQSEEKKGPFRFILNSSEAIATNMYLMIYPTGVAAQALDSGHITLEELFDALLTIDDQSFINGGRVYGGGLRKIEPKELGTIDASNIANLLPNYQKKRQLQFSF